MKELKLPLKIHTLEILLPYWFVLKQKLSKVLAALQQDKSTVFLAFKLHTVESYGHHQMDWQTHSMRLPKELDPTESNIVSIWDA